MITKCTTPNMKDGANYAVKSVAGPFGNKNNFTFFYSIFFLIIS